MNQSPTNLSSASPPAHASGFAFCILNSAFPPIGVHHAAFIRMQGADAAHEACQHKTWNEVFQAALHYAQKQVITPYLIER